MSFRPGDVIIAKVPFSDFSGAKMRPALVISSEKHNEKSSDLIALKITSREQNSQFDLPLKQENLTMGVMKMDSIIQADFPFVIEKKLCKKIAETDKETRDAVKGKLRLLFGL